MVRSRRSDYCTRNGRNKRRKPRSIRSCNLAAVVVAVVAVDVDVGARLRSAEFVICEVHQLDHLRTEEVRRPIARPSHTSRMTYSQRLEHRVRLRCITVEMICAEPFVARDQSGMSNGS